MDWSPMFHARTVFLGCGNVLFGDDGVAPRVAELLASEAASGSQVAYMDAGTSVRTLLSDLMLSDTKPSRIVVLDVVKQPDRTPGELREESLDHAPDLGATAAFLHQAPTLGLLKKLRDESGVRVQALTVQAAYMPELMDDALSPELAAALPEIVRKVRNICERDEQPPKS